MMALRLNLPPAGALVANGESDPLPFYYKPLVGRLFAARLNIGLALLKGRFKRALEIGYGSGLLMPTLATISDELYGLDLEPEPRGLRQRLESLAVHPKELVQADVKKMPFADSFFDGIIAFSIFEHLKNHELAPALAEVARVLQPGGQLLIGCPAVHKVMNTAFAAIGFAQIEQHHFSTIADVLEAARPHFSLARHDALPSLMRKMPLGWAPYTTVLLERR